MNRFNFTFFHNDNLQDDTTRTNTTRTTPPGNDLFSDLVDNIFDQFISMPLTRPRILNQDIQDAINLNHQIVARMHTLRRQLEIENEGTLPRERQQRASVTRDNTMINVFQNIMEFLINNDQSWGINTDPSVNMQDVKITLKEDDFNKLKTVVLSKDNNEHAHLLNENCNICIENYKEGDVITNLFCGHVFHSECIKTWLCGEKINCPMCRTDIRMHLHSQSEKDDTKKN